MSTPMPTGHASTPAAAYELVDTVKSGNAWKVRLLAGYLGIGLRRRTLSIVDGDLADPAFAAINPFRQVPVLRTREGDWLPESLAILWYLGRGSAFVPDGTGAQARMLAWLSFEQTQHMHALAQPRLLVHLRRTARVDDPAILAWRAQGTQALALQEQALRQAPFVGAEAPTLADVALYPYTRMAEEGGYRLAAYPAIRAWLDRMAALPGHAPLEP